MSRVYVFDLDGTIANVDHRLHYVRKPCLPPAGGPMEVYERWFKWKPDWKGFFEACIADEPITWVVDLMRGLHEGVLLEEDVLLVLSGRSNAVRKQTQDWLWRHEVPFDGLLMRPEKDFRPDEVVKADMLNIWLSARGEDKRVVQFIVDDRQKVVDMWRREGFNVLQCAAWKESHHGC